MSKTRFDKKAANWDKKQRRVELADKISTQITALPLTKNMHVMEFGCGTGLVGIPIAKQVKQLVAVDSSSGMIDTLKEKIATENIDNITPLCQNIIENPLTEKFDFIFTSMVLHHVEELDKALGSIYHHLKPGGLLAIADLDEEDGSFHRKLKGEFTHNGFNREKFSDKLQQLGFDSITFSTAHTLMREDKNGVQQPFTVFFMNAIKNRT